MPLRSGVAPRVYGLVFACHSENADPAHTGAERSNNLDATREELAPPPSGETAPPPEGAP